MARLEKMVIRDSNPPPTWRDRLSAIRSIVLGPWNPKDATLAKYFAGSAPAASGVQVSESAAFGVSAFFAAVTTIAADVASLPLFLYKRLPNGGKDRFENHPLYRLLHDAPNPELTSYQWRQATMFGVLTTGNSYSEIVRDGANRPIELWPIDPHRVSQVREAGRLMYRVAQSNGGDVLIPAADMVHLRGPSPNGLLGLDMVAIARQSLGLALAAETFGSVYFANGANVGGALTVPGRLSDQVRENLKRALDAKYATVDNAHKLLLLEDGTTFTPTAATNRDSQLLELRVHQIREIARFFRMPVSKLGDLERSTYSNAEQQQIEYYVSCLRPWLINLEQELAGKLIASSERNLQVIEFSIEGYLRGDSEKRSMYYSAMLDRGVFSINDVRRLENLPPVAGGDVPRVPMNTEPLARSWNDLTAGERSAIWDVDPDRAMAMQKDAKLQKALQRARERNW